MCALMFAIMPGIGQSEFMVTNSNKAREYSTSRFFKDEELLEVILTGEVPAPRVYDKSTPRSKGRRAADHPEQRVSV
jgi:hypothetical protein